MSRFAGKSDRKGPWTADEDRRLTAYVQSHDQISWLSVQTAAGISRSSRSCRLRWCNFLNPDIKRGNFTDEETDLISKLHRVVGNRWSIIASKLPGRTDKAVKNYWKKYEKSNNLLTPRKMSSRSKCSDGVTSNDEWSSDVSDILSELSSNAGDPCLLNEDPSFGIDKDFDLYEDFGLDEVLLDGVLGQEEEVNVGLDDGDFWKDVYSCASNCGLDQFGRDLLGISTNENGSSVGQRNVKIPFPAVAQDGQFVNKTMPNLQGLPQVDSLYVSETTLTDTDGDVDQNNGEILLSLEVIKKHFHMNMDDAVESLKV